MNRSIVNTSMHALATAILAISTAAYAQAPAGVEKRPANQADPIAADGVPGDKGQMRVDNKKANMPGATPAAARSPAARPSEETNPIASSGVAGDKAQMKVDDRKATGNAMMAMSRADRMAAMDTNHDGMISRKEYNAYHNMMWGKMNMKNGMVMSADMDAMLHAGGGPN